MSPSNIIGAKMINGLFFGLVRAVIRSRFFIAPGGVIVTYLHVEKVVRTTIKCQEAEKGSVYNLSCNFTWEALVERIATVVRGRLPRMRISLLPVRFLIAALEGWVRLLLPSGGGTSLVGRSQCSSDRMVEQFGFAFTKPMPERIEDEVRAPY